MNSLNFVYWLQGFLEVSDAGVEGTPLTLSAEQVKCIQNHIALVLTNVTKKPSQLTISPQVTCSTQDTPECTNKPTSSISGDLDTTLDAFTSGHRPKIRYC